MLIAAIIVTILLSGGGGGYIKMPKDTPKETKKTIKKADESYFDASKEKKPKKKNIEKQEEEFKKAYELYVSVAKEYPNMAELNYRTGVCAMYSGETDDALKYIAKARADSLVVTSQEMYVELGDYFQLNKQYDSAIMYYNHYLATKGHKLKKTYQNKATEGIDKCIPLICE